MNSKVNIFNINEKGEDKKRIQEGDIVLISYGVDKKELLMKVLRDSKYIKLISLSTQQVFVIERKRYSELETDCAYITAVGTGFYIVGICDLDIKIRNIIK